MGEMRIRVTGRNLDVGDALRSRIETELEAGIGRYVSRDGDGVVTLSRERHLNIVEISIHLDSGIALESRGEAGEAHAAFDAALTKIEKRVRRYKRRLKDHHAHHDRAGPPPEETASYAIVESDEGPEDVTEEEAGGAAGPVVIAETRTRIRTMAVSTAVMQLELSEQPAMMFRNPSTGALNVVYRRADGNIGWIDPGRSEAA